MASLTCVNIGKQYGGVTALQQVSVTLVGGGIFALIGPNGAGKTTLLNVVSGHALPDDGQVFIDSEDITGLPAYRLARRGICRTFQEVRLVGEMTVIENLKVGVEEVTVPSVLGRLLARVRSETDRVNARCRGALQLVGLDRFADEEACELSYGQQKLVALACGLAMDGGVFLLDEPFAGLDLSMSGRVEDLLRELRSRSKLILFVEHNIEVVRRIADRVLVMGSGRVVAEGTAEDVLSREEVVQSFLL